MLPSPLGFIIIIIMVQSRLKHGLELNISLQVPLQQFRSSGDRNQWRPFQALSPGDAVGTLFVHCLAKGLDLLASFETILSISALLDDFQVVGSLSVCRFLPVWAQRFAPLEPKSAKHADWTG
jgi:hypothetical protein